MYCCQLRSRATAQTSAMCHCPCRSSLSVAEPSESRRKRLQSMQKRLLTVFHAFWQLVLKKIWIVHRKCGRREPMQKLCNSIWEPSSSGHIHIMLLLEAVRMLYVKLHLKSKVASQYSIFLFELADECFVCQFNQDVPSCFHQRCFC